LEPEPENELMIPTLIAAVLVVAIFCAYVARVQAMRKKAGLPDPSADWWPHFERQFRAHAIRVAQQSRRRRGPGR
jgi:hypothetical protein